MVNLVEKIKEIERLVCRHFDDLEIDDPAEEGLYDEDILAARASKGKLRHLKRNFISKCRRI